jgi:hypothetical protein
MAGNHRVGQDEPVQVGKNQRLKVPLEMNELQEYENDTWNRGSGLWVIVIDVLSFTP